MDLSGIRAAVFDLDDTLYPLETPGGPNEQALRALALLDVLEFDWNRRA